ncbi:c-type cytochrome [Rhodoferax sp.]|uniref:c-type cytochrome n=1 Tax=Rhodoferax sp. TaxID=50421 RepID=UPI002759CFBA|nr:c-type cytochrome [Rhodoferax sp.]
MVGALMALLLLVGCAVEVQNRQAAQELKQLAKPPGSVYTGWRVFQDKCAGCHGPAATGTAAAPDLLPRVRDMGSRQFVSLVLRRYDWNLPPAKASSDGAAREALVDEIVQRKEYMLTMPAWQGEPSVNAHIVDLYAYLSARAQGAQGPARPAQ